MPGGPLRKRYLTPGRAMTICTVYVGDLNSPEFHWEGGDVNNNIPGRLSDEFPPFHEHYNVYFHAWVRRTGVECRQTDFGGWVARVTKQQILDFIAEGYAGDEELSWVVNRLPGLKAFVDGLSPEGLYALVATEF
jgi:hypothetical protein